MLRFAINAAEYKQHLYNVCPKMKKRYLSLEASPKSLTVKNFIQVENLLLRIY